MRKEKFGMDRISVEKLGGENRKTRKIDLRGIFTKINSDYNY